MSPDYIALRTYFEHFFPAGRDSELAKLNHGSECDRTSPPQLASEDRGIWKFLTHLDANSRVLEIGSGGLIHHLFDLEANYWLIDTCRLRLGQSERTHQEVASGLRLNYIPIDTNTHHEQWKGFFDCILIHLPSHKLKPTSAFYKKSAYSNLLGICRTWLNEQGTLVISTGNRFSYKHLELRQLLLSADLGRRAHRRVLNSQGFKQVACYGWREFGSHLESYVPLKPLEHTITAFTPLPIQGAKNRLKETIMSPGFTIVSQLSSLSKKRTIVDRILDDVVSGHQFNEKGGKLKILHHLVTRKQKLVFFSQWDEKNAILKVPLDRSARQSEANNADSLDWLSRWAGNTNLFPEPLASGTVSKQMYFLEEKVSGTALSSVFNGSNRNEFLTEVLQLLAFLYKSSQVSGQSSHLSIDESSFQRLIQSGIERIYHATGDLPLKRHLEIFFRDNFLNVELPRGILHGDFSVSNLLVEDNSICGLIDWETCLIDGIPILDALNYLDSAIRHHNPRFFVNSTIPGLAKRQLITDEENGFLDQCYKLYELSPGLHGPLVYLRWLRHTSYLANFWLAVDKDAQQRYIYEIARTL